jgi:hypothetical protein
MGSSKKGIPPIGLKAKVKQSLQRATDQRSPFLFHFNQQLIENHARGIEIKGVPLSVIARFSTRQQQIDKETRQRVEGGETVANERQRLTVGLFPNKLSRFSGLRAFRRPRWFAPILGLWLPCAIP